MTRILILTTLAVMLSRDVSASEPPVDLSVAAAERDAQRDIATRHLQIYIAGEKHSPVGIPVSDLPLVHDLPVNGSISLGIIDSRLREHVAYAEAYNRVILRYVRSHRRKPN